MSRTSGETLPVSCGSYSVDSLLGKGSYGIVYKVYRKKAKGSEKISEGNYYALKAVQTKNGPEKLKTMVENERQLMQSLTHANVVLYKESFYEEAKFCLVMEYCSGGTLYNHMRVRGSGLPESTFISYLRQISEGVKYLHSRDIIHRDLKSKNLLLKDKSYTTIKIADFGVARILKDESPIPTLTKFVGTVHFMSPEMIESKSYTNKTDIWSMGCTCVEMGTALYAFSGGNITKIKELVNNAELLNFDKVTYCDDIKDLILKMLHTNPETRPTVDEILDILMQHNTYHLEISGNDQRRRMSESSQSSNRSEINSGLLARTLPENVLANSLMSIHAERERIRRNLDLLESQSANLQGVIVSEIGQQNATETVTNIKRWYRERRLENAEDKTQRCLGEELFTRLKFLLRALSSIEDGIRHFKGKLGENIEDTSFSSSLSSSVFDSVQTM